MQDLGEDVFPEPPPAAAAPTSDNEQPKSVESQEPPANEPASPEAMSPQSPPGAGDRKTVTTVARKPLMVPDSVHVRITPETLKNYVGPPVYQKDRMYVAPPPPGVSTGLGYLGNGSGAVMPVEAMVSRRCHTFGRLMTNKWTEYAWKGWAATHRKTW